MSGLSSGVTSKRTKKKHLRVLNHFSRYYPKLSHSLPLGFETGVSIPFIVRI